MKIGIATGVYVEYPIHETIKRIAEAGYDGVDFWGGRPHLFRQDHSQKELQRIKRFLDDNELAVPSVLPAFFRYPHSLTNPNKRVWDDSLTYMKLCIQNAVELGAGMVLVVPTKSLYGQTPEDAWKLLAEGVDISCNYASQFGVSIGLEAVNHYVSNLINTASDALRMIDELNHPNLGVVLDTGHMHLCKETITEAITVLGDRLLQVHVNDNDGEHQQNQIPGDGTFDFSCLISELKRGGYTGFLTAELGYQYASDPDIPVRLTLERLRELIR